MAPQGSLKKRWCFTAFDYPVDWMENLKKVDAIEYCVVGVETCPKTQKLHLQGYLELEKRKRGKALQKLFKKAGFTTQVHLTGARGTAEQNQKYCKKTRAEDKEANDVVAEWGEPSVQGRRTDLLACFARMQEGATNSQIRDEFTSCHARNHKWITSTIEELAEERELKRRRLTLLDRELRGWQASVLASLAAQTSRTVTWVWEETGGVGKTWLADYLVDQEEAFVVTGGKWSDIAYAYNRQRVVVFDLARCQKEMVPYKVMEDFKNGRLFSPKYESVTMTFPSCHVMVLANYAPDKTQLSADRWDIHNIITV